MTKKENYSLIDSKHRGINVYDESGNVLGKTPFIYRFNTRGKALLLNKKFGLKKEVRCKPDYKRSILPNLIFSPFAFPLGLGASISAYGLDYYNKKMHICPSNVFLNNKQGGLEEKTHRVLVLPIYQGRLRDYNELIFKAEKTLKSKKMEIINYDKSLEDFLYHSIGEDKEWFVSNIRKDILLKILHKFQATKIMEVKIAGAMARVRVVDPFNLNSVEKTMVRIKNIEKRKLSIRDYVKKYFHFFPNSLVFGPTTYTAKFGEGDDPNLERHPDALPSAFSLFSIESTESPYLYSQWDYTGSIAPSLSFPSWKNEFTDEFGVIQTMQAQTAILTLDFMAIAHTPLGALGIGLGYGGIYAFGSETNGKEYNGVNSIVKFRVDYKAFISKRIYFMMNVSNYKLTNNTIKSSKIDVDEVHTATIGIGYYFPELTSLVDSYL